MFVGIQPSKIGTWVMHEDTEKLEAEQARLNKLLNELTTINVKLLQENEELKQELAIINRPPRQHSEDRREG